MARRELNIEQVQRWVISFLILAVSSFPLGAMTAATVMLVDDERRSDAVLILAVMAVLGVLALGAIRLVHRRPPLSPWLLCGVLPASVAAVWIFTR